MRTEIDDKRVTINDRGQTFRVFVRFVPKSLSEAIEYVYSRLTPRERDFIRENSTYSVHFTTGMSMRNEWGFWKNGTPFKADIKKRFNLFGHGDDCSGLVLAGVWARVKGEDEGAVLEQTAKRYHEHWISEGVNPETGEAAKNSMLTGEKIFFLSAQGIREIEDVAARTVRVCGDAECIICGKKFRDHPWFLGDRIDDGCGRLVPWLREGCDGKLLKL